MYRLIIKESGSGETLFISQLFNRYKMHEQEVETECGRLAVREGLQAAIIRADGTMEYSMNQGDQGIPNGTSVLRECA